VINTLEKIKIFFCPHRS